MKFIRIRIDLSFHNLLIYGEKMIMTFRKHHFFSFSLLFLFLLFSAAEALSFGEKQSLKGEVEGMLQEMTSFKDCIAQTEAFNQEWGKKVGNLDPSQYCSTWETNHTMIIKAVQKKEEILPV